MSFKNMTIGTKVTSKFRSNESDVVRTITIIYEDITTGSGYRASADGGEVCKCCGLNKGKPIEFVDANWFVPYEDN